MHRGQLHQHGLILHLTRDQNNPPHNNTVVEIAAQNNTEMASTGHKTCTKLQVQVHGQQGTIPVSKQICSHQQVHMYVYGKSAKANLYLVGLVHKCALLGHSPIPPTTSTHKPHPLPCTPNNCNGIINDHESQQQNYPPQHSTHSSKCIIQDNGSKCTQNTITRSITTKIQGHKHCGYPVQKRDHLKAHKISTQDSFLSTRRAGAAQCTYSTPTNDKHLPTHNDPCYKCQAALIKVCLLKDHIWIFSLAAMVFTPVPLTLQPQLTSGELLLIVTYTN